jgi:nucleoside-diphosphate-sugar epimerase
MRLIGKKVAVTGGAGLIGSFLVDELVAVGADVIVADDFSKGRREHLVRVLDKIEIRTGDLETLTAMESAIDGVDVVFHLASRAYGIGYSTANHLAILQHNERITNNLLQVLARKPVQHLLVTSSSCVYPDNGPDTIPELSLYSGEPEAANWGYGWAKRFLEQKSLLLNREIGIPITIVRPFNIYGERYTWVGENSQAIPMQVKKVLDGDNPVIIWGSGTQRRNYLHASDCARAMLALVERNFMGTVNIGTEDTVTLRELVERVCRLTGRRPGLDIDLEKPEGRRIKSADAGLLRKILPDFQVTVDLDQGLVRMIDWYSSAFQKASKI